MRGEPGERPHALVRAPFGVAADEPHEHGHERQRQQHDGRRHRVDHGGQREHGDRDDDREHDLWEVPGIGGLERVEPADCDRRHLGALDAVERRGPVAQPAPDEVETEL